MAAFTIVMSENPERKLKPKINMKRSSIRRDEIFGRFLRELTKWFAENLARLPFECLKMGQNVIRIIFMLRVLKP